MWLSSRLKDGSPGLVQAIDGFLKKLLSMQPYCNTDVSDKPDTYDSDVTKARHSSGDGLLLVDWNSAVTTQIYYKLETLPATDLSSSSRHIYNILQQFATTVYLQWHAYFNFFSFALSWDRPFCGEPSTAKFRYMPINRKPTSCLSFPTCSENDNPPVSRIEPVADRSGSNATSLMYSVHLRAICIHRCTGK